MEQNSSKKMKKFIDLSAVFADWRPEQQTIDSISFSLWSIKFIHIADGNHLWMNMRLLTAARRVPQSITLVGSV